VRILPTIANLNWYWCVTHALAHRGTFHNAETEESCADVGEFSTQEEAEAWPSMREE